MHTKSDWIGKLFIQKFAFFFYIQKKEQIKKSAASLNVAQYWFWKCVYGS